LWAKDLQINLEPEDLDVLHKNGVDDLALIEMGKNENYQDLRMKFTSPPYNMPGPHISFQ